MLVQKFAPAPSFTGDVVAANVANGAAIIMMPSAPVAAFV
jgi:hypothetical protein